MSKTGDKSFNVCLPPPLPSFLPKTLLSSKKFLRNFTKFIYSFSTNSTIIPPFLLLFSNRNLKAEFCEFKDLFIDKIPIAMAPLKLFKLTTYSVHLLLPPTTPQATYHPPALSTPSSNFGHLPKFNEFWWFSKQSSVEISTRWLMLGLQMEEWGRRRSLEEEAKSSGLKWNHWIIFTIFWWWGRGWGMRGWWVTHRSSGGHQRPPEEQGEGGWRGQKVPDI